MVKVSAKDRRALNLMISQTKNFIVFTLTTAAIVVLGIMSLLIIKSFVDQVIVAHLYTKISLHVVPFILTFIAIAIFMVVRTRAKALLVANVSSKLIKDAFSALLLSDINEAKSAETEALVGRIVKNSEIISGYYLERNVLPFIENVSLLVGLLLASFIVQPIFGLVMLLLLPFFFIAGKGLELFASKTNKHYDETLENNQNKINGSYEKLKNIKLLNGFKQEQENLNELTNDYISTYTFKSFFSSFSKATLIVLFSGLLISIALGIGGVLYEAGNRNINAGTFLYYAIVAPVCFALLYSVLHYDLVSDAVKQAEVELATLALMRSEGKAEPVINLDEIHTVKFKDFVYAGNEKKPIINNITFEVKRGEKIGIYVTEKIEKDAIFDSFTKLSRQKSGEISINNCDIAKIAPAYLRQVVATISSDSCVLADTLLNNVCYPHDFDEYKYNDALYRSGLKSIVEKLPEKEATLIDENFNSISLVDEKNSDFTKRVIFANAFYKDSKIYLLNDATDELNPTIESELLGEIFKLKNKIIVMMTDKPYLLNKCDKILIIENGEAVEYGKYDDLMNNKDSYFYKLIKKVVVRKMKVS